MNSSTENVTGACRLCLLPAELQKSHIYPKFTYKRMRSADINNRFISFSTCTPELPDGEEIQDGYKERLLCWDCEQRLQKWEDYFARLVNQKRVFDWRPQLDRKHVLVQGIEYEKTKLYLMSLLWRSAITSDPSFALVRLGSAHTGRLREMLHAGNPGEPHEYGCLVSVPYIRQEGGEVVSRMPVTSNPENCRYQHGLRLVRMMIDGLLLNFVVGAADLVARHPTCQLFLQRDGSMRVGTEDAMNIAFLREGWKETIMRSQQRP